MRTVRFLILLLLTTQAVAHAENGLPADRTLSPYFFVDGERPGVESFPLKSTDVTTNITGVIADVTVTQVYENHGTSPIHAKYVFPGSTRAAVHGLRIRIGDKAVVARIREREAAKKEFTEAKAAGKSAALLEQQRPNVFTMEVSNILPGDRVEVELVYSEMLTPEQGVYQFVYPTVVGPRYSSAPESGAPDDSLWVKSPYLHQDQQSPAGFSIRVNLSTGVPLADLRSPSHQPTVSWESPSLAHVSLNNEAANRDFILDYRLSGRQIESGLLVYQGDQENFFLLTVQPPERVAATDIPPREYIFVLDVSGSMYGFPLNTAKRVLAQLIGNLKATDTFNVVLFAGGSRLLSPSSLTASRGNINRALAVIDGERGGGGTELQAALARAIGLPRSRTVSRSVVVVTDGFISQESGAFDLIHENLGNTNFFAFGIGSSVNRYLIEGIARAGLGEPFVVIGPEEADAAGERFRQYIESPVLTAVKVKFDGFETFDVEPEAQPDLFAERPVVVMGKWRGPKQGTIEVTGKSGKGTFRKTLNVEDSVSSVENGALPQLWARTRIARLSDFNFGSGDQAEAAREVTSLGLTYSLVTRYTSFIAVLEEIRNTTGQGDNVDQPLPLPAGVTDLAVGVGFGTGAEPGFWILLLGAGVFFTWVARRRARAC